MKFFELRPGDVFRVPHPWKDIKERVMMKVISTESHMNAVYINHWRAGTLDVMNDQDEVVKLYSTYSD